MTKSAGGESKLSGRVQQFDTSLVLYTTQHILLGTVSEQL